MQIMSWKVPLAILLMVFLSLTVGIELVLLISILELMGITVMAGNAAELSGLLSSIFNGMGISPTLLMLLALYVFVISLHALLYRFQSKINIRLQAGFAARLRQRLYQVITKTNWLFFSRKRASDFTHAMTHQAERMDSLTHHFLALTGGVLVVSIYLLLASQLSVILTGIVFTCGVALLFFLKEKAKIAHQVGEKISHVTNGMYAAVIEHMAGMKTTKSYCAEDRNQDIFSRLTVEVAQTRVDAVDNLSRVTCWFEIGAVVALSFVLYVSFKLLSFSTGGVLLLIYVYSKIMPRLSNIQQNYQMFINLLPAFRTVKEIELECKAHVEPQDIREEKIVFKRAIKLENISFNYDGDKNHEALFYKLNLSIPANKTTAIVGPSGSGKSTVCDLMMGLIVPTEGHLLVDDTDLGPEHLRSWREQIGYVTQDTFLFHDTIRANLLWACPWISNEDIYEALRLSACEEFVSRLPCGIETLVGDRGVLLSGGERQRLALARALVRKPSLLILDEATNSLDSENENKILEAIEKLHGQMTILIISHRLSTVCKADVIHVLDKRQLVESGDWEELVLQPTGRFRALWDAQRIGRETASLPLISPAPH